MKLEARHLAPYLPYNLQVEYRGKVTTLDALDSAGGAFVGENRMVSFVNQRHIKPILRALSSITKEESIELLNIIITDDNIEKIHIDIVGNLIVFESQNTHGEYVVSIDTDDGSVSAIYEDYSSLSHSYTIPYKAYEWLFSKHFDIFGLIEQDLAINKDKL